MSWYTPQPRDWPEDFHMENGEYSCRCVGCAEMFVGHKRRMVCKICTQAELDKTPVVTDTPG